MNKSKEDISHIARFRTTDFYLITDEQTEDSLKYTLGACIALDRTGLFYSGDDDTVEDEIEIIPIEKYDRKIHNNFESHAFRNVKDIENFFMRLT